MKKENEKKNSFSKKKKGENILYIDKRYPYIYEIYLCYNNNTNFPTK